MWLYLNSVHETKPVVHWLYKYILYFSQGPSYSLTILTENTRKKNCHIINPKHACSFCWQCPQLCVVDITVVLLHRRSRYNSMFTQAFSCPLFCIVHHHIIYLNCKVYVLHGERIKKYI